MAYTPPDTEAESDPTSNQPVPDGKGNLVFRSTKPLTPDDIKLIQSVYHGPMSVTPQGIAIPTSYITKTMIVAMSAMVAAPYLAPAFASAFASGAPAASTTAPVTAGGGTAGAGVGAAGAGGAAAGGGGAAGGGVIAGLPGEMATLPTLGAAGTEAGAAGAAGAGGPMIGGTSAADFVGPIQQTAAPRSVASFLTNPNVLSTVIGGGLNLVGAGIASHANTEAAKLQAKSLADALAYEKQRDAYLQGLERQRYSELNQRLEPYMAAGRTQGDRLATLLGVNPASYQYGTAAGADAGPGPVVTPPYPPASPPSPYENFRPRPADTPSLGTAVPRAGYPPPDAAPVNMRAPDGSMKAVPRDQVAHFQSRGAQVVG